MKIFYNFLIIPSGRALIFILTFFNKKLAEREKKWKSTLKELDSLPQNKKRVWFHAASMGEFEQAKPVIENLKENDPKLIVIVSFFSPSGYQNQKNYEYADAVVYLPFDASGNVRLFLTKADPDVAVFVRYEIWLNYLEELNNRQVPTTLICATIPGKEKPADSFIAVRYYRHCFNLFDRIFTVGEKHTQYLQSMKINTEITTSADTRFDRIIKSVESAAENPIVPPSYFRRKFVLVAGSSWQPDEEIIINAYNSLSEDDKDNIKLVLVPHEPTTANIERLQSALPDSILLSEIESNPENINNAEPKHIIVDSIGKLLRLYVVADAAYIGGAFGVGVHSVTEPAGYGIPLITGPKFNNSPDAVNLKNSNALSVIRNSDDFKKKFSELYDNENTRKAMGEKAREYVYAGKGVSNDVAEYIKSLL